MRLLDHASITVKDLARARRAYGQEGLLVADLDLSMATRLLASRCRTSPM